MNILDSREKFLEVYANLPLSLRKEIVVVVNDEPFTWNSASLEIKSNGEIGKTILKKLVAMEIIKNG